MCIMFSGCLKIQYFNEKKTVNVVVNYASKEVVNLKAVGKENRSKTCYVFCLVCNVEVAE